MEGPVTLKIGTPDYTMPGFTPGPISGLNSATIISSAGKPLYK
jgi:hypothetical protein